MSSVYERQALLSVCAKQGLRVSQRQEMLTRGQCRAEQRVLQPGLPGRRRPEQELGPHCSATSPGAEVAGSHPRLAPSPAGCCPREAATEQGRSEPEVDPQRAACPPVPPSGLRGLPPGQCPRLHVDHSDFGLFSLVLAHLYFVIFDSEYSISLDFQLKTLFQV